MTFCVYYYKYFAVKNSSEEELIVAAEITKIYHTITHNQSYNSLDCSFKLDKFIFEDSKLAGKISCGRTKCEAIAQNVLASRSLFHLYRKLKITILHYFIPYKLMLLIKKISNFSLYAYRFLLKRKANKIML